MNKLGILIDLDGTVCDSKYAISYLNGERDTNNYETYYRTLDKSEPNIQVVDHIIHRTKTILRNNNSEIPVTLVFLTGRTAEIHAVNSSLAFINRYFVEALNNPKVHYDFYFRPINYHSPSIEYKVEKFKILKELYNFTDIYEDELTNVCMFHEHRQEGCLVHWVKNSYDFALENQVTTVPEGIVIHELN